MNHRHEMEQWSKRIHDYNIVDEPLITSVSDAKKFLKASILYATYELTDEDESAMQTVRECADAIELLVAMEDTDAVKLSYHPMGAIMVTKLEEVK